MRNAVKRRIVYAPITTVSIVSSPILGVENSLALNNSEYLISKPQYVEDTIGLSGTDLEKYYNRVRTESESNLVLQMKNYQSVWTNMLKVKHK
jgi:hypothetical protein